MDWVDSIFTEYQTGERELPVECKCDDDDDSIHSLMEKIKGSAQEIERIVNEPMLGEDQRHFKHLFDAKHGF